jgi:hypothetical protein
MRWNRFAATTAAVLFTASFAVAHAETLTGTVSDTMCGKSHMMPGKSDADCTRACVKEGSDYALVVGDKVYTLKGDKAAIDKFAGATATVTGTTKGDTITVTSIKGGK